MGVEMKEGKGDFSPEEWRRKIEERVLELENKTKKLEAERAIANLMGRYAFYCGAGEGERIITELWTKSEEASLEYGASGVYRELWKVRAFYLKKAIPGVMTTVSFSTPYLRISQDLKSATGVWMAFSTETDAGDLGVVKPLEADTRRVLLSSTGKDGKRYRAEILLQKYEVEFRMEEGEWRIYNLHVSEYFRCPYDRDWVRYAAERFVTDGMWLESLFESPEPLPPCSHGENLPSEASTEHWQYAPDRLPGALPVVLREERES